MVLQSLRLRLEQALAEVQEAGRRQRDERVAPFLFEIVRFAQSEDFLHDNHRSRFAA
jgi:hypothetical protein